MEYKVDLKPCAVRDFASLARNIQLKKAVALLIDSLKQDPRPLGVKKLSQNQDLYRLRTEGNYRIVYKIDDAARVVLVVRIRHRREVYRRL